MGLDQLDGLGHCSVKGWIPCAKWYETKNLSKWPQKASLCVHNTVDIICCKWLACVDMHAKLLYEGSKTKQHLTLQVKGLDGDRWKHQVLSSHGTESDTRKDQQVLVLKGNKVFTAPLHRSIFYMFVPINTNRQADITRKFLIRGKDFAIPQCHLCSCCVDWTWQWTGELLGCPHHQVMCWQNICEMPGKQAIYWYFLSGNFLEHPLLAWQKYKFEWISLGQHRNVSWVCIGATYMMHGNAFERCTNIPTMQWCVQKHVQVSSIIPQLDSFAWSLKKISACVNCNGLAKRLSFKDNIVPPRPSLTVYICGTSSTFLPVKMTDTFVPFLSSHQIEGHSLKHETPHCSWPANCSCCAHTHPQMLEFPAWCGICMSKWEAASFNPTKVFSSLDKNNCCWTVAFMSLCCCCHFTPPNNSGLRDDDAGRAWAGSLSRDNKCFTWCLMKSKKCDYWKQKLHVFFARSNSVTNEQKIFEKLCLKMKSVTWANCCLILFVQMWITAKVNNFKPWHLPQLCSLSHFQKKVFLSQTQSNYSGFRRSRMFTSIPPVALFCNIWQQCECERKPWQAKHVCKKC